MPDAPPPATGLSGAADDGDRSPPMDKPKKKPINWADVGDDDDDGVAPTAVASVAAEDKEDDPRVLEQVALRLAGSKLDDLDKNFFGKIEFIVPQGKEEPDVIKTWQDSALDNDLKQSIVRHYPNVTPIQRKAIPILIKGENLIAQSQTGTGKTGAFAIGILQRVDAAKKYPQAIVVANTHEIAMQAKVEIERLGKDRGITCTCSTPSDGAAVGNDRPILDHVVCSAVGTMNKWIKTKQVTVKGKRKTEKARFDASKISIVIVDEADCLLLDDKLRKQITGWPLTMAQWAFFSATIPREGAGGFVDTCELLIGTRDKARLPYKIFLKPDATLQNIFQYQIDCAGTGNSRDNRDVILRQLFKYAIHKLEKTFIFCNTKRAVDQLHDMLNREHHVARMHSDVRGEDGRILRQEVVDKFKAGDVQIVVCTDLMERGIDIPNARTVINYDLPIVFTDNRQAQRQADFDSYVHRIGRAGRVGQPGIAISFTGYDRDADRMMGEIEHRCGRLYDGRRKIPRIGADPTKWEEEIKVDG